MLAFPRRGIEVLKRQSGAFEDIVLRLGQLVSERPVKRKRPLSDLAQEQAVIGDDPSRALHDLVDRGDAAIGRKAFGSQTDFALIAGDDAAVLLLTGDRPDESRPAAIPPRRWSRRE